MRRVAPPSRPFLTWLGGLLLAGPAGAAPAQGPSVDGRRAERLAHSLEQLGVTRWHASGYRGAGVKVAVLDSGFRGYRSKSGPPWPTAVAARSFRFDADLEAPDTQHGLLVADVVHVIAPDAELLFAN